MLSLGNKLTLNTQPIYHFVNKHSIVFDGVDDCIITDGADTVAQNTTYSFWCKSSKTTENKIFGHGGTQIGSFWFNSAGNLYPLLFVSANHYARWEINTAQDDGEWHHWVLYQDVNNAANCKLYCDGILQTQNLNASGSLTTYTESLTIGGTQASGGSYFVGNIDEFAVFDRELTQAEITRMYNTYYSPNRVANGNFAQIGNEEVENGNFSEVGAEEVVNGDFASDSDWTLGGGWSISNGKLIGNNATGYALQGGVFESGVSKIYKITLTVSDYVSGYFTILTSGGTSQSQQFNANGDYTIYFNTNSPSGTTLHFTYFGSFTGSIDNVSVKEVGQDWTVYGNSTISNGKANLNSGTGAFANTLLQSSVVTNLKSYKISFTISNYQEGEAYISIGFNTSFVVNSDGDYTFYGISESGDNTNFLVRNGASNFIGSITNISVKEVGQGWTFGTGWSTDGTKAISDGSQTGNSWLIQGGVLVTGKTYKFSFDLVVNSGQVVIDSYASPTPLTSTNFYEFSFVASTSSFQVLANSTFTGSVDNIVVQELKHDATNLMLNAGAYQSANPLITSTNSMEFDGISDFLIANSTLGSFTGSFSCWIIRNNNSSYDYILDTRGVSSGGTGYIYLNTGDNTVLVSSGTIYVNGVATNQVLADGNWHNVVVTGMTLDIDDIRFGVSKSGSFEYDGKITEAGIYNRVLTSLEVASLYNQGMPTNLLVNRNDYQSGNPTVFNTKQVDFDGVDDFMQISPLGLTGTFTFSFWYKGSENDDFLFGQTGTNKKIGFVAGGIFIRINTASDFTITKPDSAEWNYIVITRDSGNKIDLYVNGGSANRLFSDAGQASVVNFDLIGKTNSGQNYDGQLSQIGVWNSTLTADEVSSLYNHGLPVDLNTDQAAYTSSSNLVGYWRMGSGTLDTYPLIADQTNATLGSEILSQPVDLVADFTTNGGGVIVDADTFTTGGGSFDGIRKNNFLTVGKIYKLIIAGNTTSSGFTIGDILSSGNEYGSGFGTYYFTALGVTIWIRQRTTGTTNITSFSIKEVQGNPAIMTNMTASDIENGSPYANIVQNGDFTTNIDFWEQYNSVSTWDNGSIKTTSNSTVAWIRQNDILSTGNVYKITFKAKASNISQNLNIWNGSSFRDTGLSFNSANVYKEFTYTLNFTGIGGQHLILGQQVIGNNDSINFDNVTVTEVNTGLQGYWKMGSGINDEYPVIYDQTNPTLGAELVTNGDFATDSDWTYGDGWNIEDGFAKCNGTQTGNSIFYQNLGDLSNKTVKFTFTINNFGGGELETSFFGASGTTVFEVTANGDYTFYINVQSGHNGNTGFTANSSFIGYVDNVSIKEVQGNSAYMTNMVEGNITNQYPLTKIRNYYRMGDGILDGYPIIQDQTSPNLAHIPTTNTLLYSEDFSQYTTSGTITLTSGQLAPDGTLTATKVVGVIGASSFYRAGETGTAATRSIYARTVTGTGTANLTSYNTNSNNTFTLTEEWQRFELTGSSATGGTNFYAIDFRGSPTLSELIIWGGQSEEQTQATAYLPSYGVASVRKATTTNLITYSEDFSQSSWTKTGSSVTSGFTSPIGNTNAYSLIEDTSTGVHSIKPIAVSSNTYTLSVYAKYNGRILQLASTSTGGHYANFDLLNGVIGNFGVTTTNVTMTEISNGWYRCSMTTTSNMNTAIINTVQSKTSVYQESYTGDGTSGIYIFGSQIEQQTQVETYAKTTGLPVTIDLFTENNYGTMTNMSASDIVPDTPNN